jgi:hypothetical protein
MRKISFLLLVTIVFGLIGCSGGDEAEAPKGPPPTDAQAGDQNKPLTPNN